MKLPAIVWGGAAGLAALLVLAPATGSAIGRLAETRAERARLAAIAAVPEREAPALVPEGRAAGADPALLVARIRSRAHDAGVLVEQVSVARGEGALVRLRLSFSGSEKAVVALADALERETLVVRFASWKIEPVDGGVRLSGSALAVRR